jgi:NAD(P)H dehydrogenase (quinone)
MKILVTGATGHLGSVAIDTLLNNIPPQQISVLARKEEKRLVLQDKGLKAYLGNYDDIESLQKAMADVDAVLLISSTDEGNRIQQHKNVVDAAINTGVKNIAYTSRCLRDSATISNQLMLEHFATENYIRESGLKYTIFQNALYMDVLPLFVGKQVFEKGIFQPAGDGKVAFALRKDIGEAMINVLLNEPFENKVYRFTGRTAYTFYDVAFALSELSGRPVKYTPVEIPSFKALMEDKGLPESVVKKIVDFNTDIKNGQEATVTSDLEDKLGRKSCGLNEGLKILFGI